MATHTGRQAEAVAAEYFADHGYKILSTNWRNRWCEIDIVAQKRSSRLFRRQNIIYLIEVKYRRSSLQGSGLEYVTTRKRQQMEFAARHWQSENDWNGDIRLCAVAVSGEGFLVDEVIEF